MRTIRSGLVAVVEEPPHNNVSGFGSRCEIHGFEEGTAPATLALDPFRIGGLVSTYVTHQSFVPL